MLGDLSSRHLKSETAWAGTGAFSGKNWATYFIYTVTSTSLLEGWTIETNSIYSGVSEHADAIYFSAGEIGAQAYIYKAFTSQSGFTYSLKVQNPPWWDFLMLITGSVPMMYANPRISLRWGFPLPHFELNGVDVTGVLTNPSQWYTLKLVVEPDPYTVNAQVYSENGDLIGSATVTNPTLSFTDISYVGCGVSSHSAALVKDIVITGG